MESLNIPYLLGYALASVFFLTTLFLGYLYTKKSREAQVSSQNYALSQQARASIEEAYYKTREELEKIRNQIEDNHQKLVEAQKSETAAREYVTYLQKQADALTEKLSQTEKEAKENHNAFIKAQADMKTAQEILEAERKILEETKLKFHDAFKGLAASALEGNNQQFFDLAKEFFKRHSEAIKGDMTQKQQSLEGIIKPLSNSIERYHLLLHELEMERQRSYQTIETELKKVTETGSTLTKETRALKDALKKPHVRGRWGEIQLKNCVELAGMSEFADFSLQTATASEEGNLLIPDMTVRMPGGRVVLVDSKVPLDAFLESFEATTEEAQVAATARHGRQVKDHVKRLAMKDYGTNISESADFTVMFLPNESFLYAALEVEADLMEYALQQKILIATPPTFIGLLKVIRYGWNEDRLARNAQEISNAGRELHKRLIDFVEAFENIGYHLEKAKEEFDKGKTRLSSRVLVQARRMESLGIKSKKELPEHMGYDDQFSDVLEQAANDDDTTVLVGDDNATSLLFENN